VGTDGALLGLKEKLIKSRKGRDAEIYLGGREDPEEDEYEEEEGEEDDDFGSDDHRDDEGGEVVNDLETTMVFPASSCAQASRTPEPAVVKSNRNLGAGQQDDVEVEDPHSDASSSGEEAVETYWVDQLVQGYGDNSFEW